MLNKLQSVLQFAFRSCKTTATLHQYYNDVQKAASVNTGFMTGHFVMSQLTHV